MKIPKELGFEKVSDASRFGKCTYAVTRNGVMLKFNDKPIIIMASNKREADKELLYYLELYQYLIGT